MSMDSGYRSLMAAVLRHPSVIPHALRAAWVFRARYWYRRFPFLPLPPASYLRWRMETAYGSEMEKATPQEMVRYLRWSTELRRGAR